MTYVKDLQNLEITHSTRPKLIEPNVDTNKTIIGHCKCPVDLRYGLIVPAIALSPKEKKKRVCHMYCEVCGEYINVYLPE